MRGDAAPDDVVANEKKYGHDHAQDDALRCLEEERDVAGAGDAEPVRANEVLAGNGLRVARVVGVALGDPRDAAILRRLDLDDAVRDDAPRSPPPMRGL